MTIDYSTPTKVKIIQEALLVRHTLAFEVERPVQAWQWMNQSRTIPDHQDWVRPEVTEAWRRCLDDYHLPLGNYANWAHFPLVNTLLESALQVGIIEALIKQLSHNFTVFLEEAGVMMVLTAADGALLTVMGAEQPHNTFMRRLYEQGTCWQEQVLGNNGIGSAIQLKKPIAFQGMEHFLSALHPFTTVGYPLLDDSGQLLAVIGLVSTSQECMSSLFAFLHLIGVLVNTNLPLTQSVTAQERVLEKIHFKPAKKTASPLVQPLDAGALEALIQKAVKLQTYKMPILITGESGVGKDHFVGLLKQAGPRKDAPFIAINCASIPRDLIESELFGYESGSFTGARSNGKPGKFMLADKGILFLDEIGDMSFDLQSTLLRVLESSEFTPVGGSTPVRVDVQIVAATNVPLLKAVESGHFRRDLYYRLNGAQIHLKPLRERPDKIALIHQLLQRELEMIVGDDPIEISQEVLHLFEQHPWPGNIRQLINVIRATLYTAGSTYIGLQDLPQDFMAESKPSQENVNDFVERRMPSRSTENQSSMNLADWEYQGIKSALKESEGNISMAAKKLGITRSTLYKKIDLFKLNKVGDEVRA